MRGFRVDKKWGNVQRYGEVREEQGKRGWISDI